VNIQVWYNQLFPASAILARKDMTLCLDHPYKRAVVYPNVGFQMAKAHNVCDFVFRELNVNIGDYPETLRSLSTTDVVQLDDRFFVCDNHGWYEITVEDLTIQVVETPEQLGRILGGE
jgi:hypothetical protein